jgi:DNA repair exonuclease SbcCD ATPase subunit
MTDLLLQRLERLFLLVLRLGPCDPDRLGKLCLVAWSGRHLSDQVSTLAAERNELIAERNDALTKLDQLQRSVGNLEQVETKLSAARAEQNRVVELTESKAQTAKDEIAGLIKRMKQVENPERVPGTGSTPQVETATQRSRAFRAALN